MTSNQLIDTTAWLFGIDRALLMSRSRATHVVEARQALAWSLRQSGWSLESIGDLLRRDHTTIIYALKAVECKIKHNKRFAERLQVLTPAVEAPIDWQARCAALETRVAELERLLAARSNP